MRTFNNGIGLILVVPDNSVQEIQERLQAMNEKSFIIGEIAERKESDEKIIWV
jgi:phosphoribosylformylglycinamidine cyclo-ligase